MHADDNNTQYKMVLMVKHSVSSIFSTNWLRLDLFNMAAPCRCMEKNIKRQNDHLPTRFIVCTPGEPILLFQTRSREHKEKFLFSSLLFPYGWHFPPVSFEEFLTPGVFLCCQFVAGLVRMRIFPASIIPESSDTRCFYPLKKQKSKTQSFPQNFLQFWSSWLRIEKIHRRQLNTSDTLNCMYGLFCWCTVCFIEKLSLRVNL